MSFSTLSRPSSLISSSSSRRVTLRPSGRTLIHTHSRTTQNMRAKHHKLTTSSIQIRRNSWSQRHHQFSTLNDEKNKTKTKDINSPLTLNDRLVELSTRMTELTMESEEVMKILEKKAFQEHSDSTKKEKDGDSDSSDSSDSRDKALTNILLRRLNLLGRESRLIVQERRAITVLINREAAKGQNLWERFMLQIAVWNKTINASKTKEEREREKEEGVEEEEESQGEKRLREAGEKVYTRPEFFARQEKLLNKEREMLAKLENEIKQQGQGTSSTSTENRETSEEGGTGVGWKNMFNQTQDKQGEKTKDKDGTLNEEEEGGDHDADQDKDKRKRGAKFGIKLNDEDLDALFRDVARMNSDEFSALSARIRSLEAGQRRRVIRFILYKTSTPPLLGTAVSLLLCNVLLFM